MLDHLRPISDLMLPTPHPFEMSVVLYVHMAPNNMSRMTPKSYYYKYVLLHIAEPPPLFALFSQLVLAFYYVRRTHTRTTQGTDVVVAAGRPSFPRPLLRVASR